MVRLKCIANFLRSNKIVLAILLASSVAYGATYFKDTFVERLTADNLRLDVNTISSINANGNILITPNGTGKATFRDANLIIQDSVDLTKQWALELGAISTATTRTWSMPDSSDTFVGLTSTQTLTNKTLTSPSITSATLTTPTTDVVTFDDQTTPSNPAAGFFKLYFKADGELYKLNSVGAEAQFASSATLPNSTYRSVVATETATAADDVLLLSGASFTENLFTAVGNTGKVLVINHGGTHLTQVYTIDPAGAETIDGLSTYPLYTNGESVKIISDGTNWILIEHKASTEWIDAGLVVIGASTTAPTKGSTANLDKAHWRREGQNAIVRMNYVQTSAVGSSAGSGDYLFTLPTGLVADTSIIACFATPQGTGFGAVRRTMLGAVNGTLGSATSDFEGAAYCWDSTRMVFIINVHLAASNNGGVISDGYQNITNANISYHAEVTVPISGWRE